MSQFAERIAAEFPLRCKQQEKENMRTYLVGQFKALGYPAKVQSGRGSSANVVVGDAENARVLVTAHYDTPRRDIFPSLICPTRPESYILYQALTPVLLVLAAFVLSVGLTFVVNKPALTLPLFIALLLFAMVYFSYGPADTRTMNNSTSAVAALLETASVLTPRHRSKVAFVFFDGSGGAREFRKKYPSSREKTVIHVDCVGSGDEILFLPSKYSRWNDEVLSAILESFKDVEKPEEKSVYLKTDGLVYYPGENRHFRYSIAVCACNKVKGFGRCILPTRGDNRVEEENLRILRDGLAKLIACFDN